MKLRLLGSVVALSMLAVACSGSDSASNEPIYGTEDTVCASVRLANEENDDAVLASAVDCLIAEIDAGRAVTVDIAAVTVEGDPIYNRFAYDGDKILIVEDNRADEFGRPFVLARSCTGISTSQWFPEGTDCEPADHPGFPEAVAEE